MFIDKFLDAVKFMFKLSMFGFFIHGLMAGYIVAWYLVYFSFVAGTLAAIIWHINEKGNKNDLSRW